METNVNPIFISLYQVRQNMPKVFKKFPKTRTIIDCTEVFIERPTSLLARQETWSNYKSHNTAKYLVCVTPWGTISYLSKGWGGRASDKFIVNNSGRSSLVSCCSNKVHVLGYTD